MNQQISFSVILQVQLVIQRQLGAQGVVTVVYQTTASTAVPGQDYVEISGGVVRLRDGQQTATVTIGLLAENSPELEKVFFVNLTSVDSSDGNQGELETQQTPTEFYSVKYYCQWGKKVTGFLVSGILQIILLLLKWNYILSGLIDTCKVGGYNYCNFILMVQNLLHQWISAPNRMGFFL